MPVITRALLFLYSTPNIVGLVLSLPSLLLYALGAIQAMGIVIVIGLYLAGLLVTPRRTITDFSIDTPTSADEIQMKWDVLVQETGRGASAEMHAKMKSIRASIFAMLPLLAGDRPDDNSLTSVRYIVLVYLPDALQTYCSLPPALAKYHPIRGGKSAYQLLNEQLDLIEREMRKISALAHTQDKRKLTSHSQIMERAVGQQRFLGDFLGTPPLATAITQSTY